MVTSSGRPPSSRVLCGGFTGVRCGRGSGADKARCSQPGLRWEGEIPCPAALHLGMGHGFPGSTAARLATLGPHLRPEPDADAQGVYKAGWVGVRGPLPSSVRDLEMSRGLFSGCVLSASASLFALASPWRPAFDLNRTRSR